MNNLMIQNTTFLRRHRTFFVGLFLIIPALTIVSLLFYRLMKLDFLHGWITLHAMYNNSCGLTKGNQVTVSGMSIGHINQIDLEREGRVWVQFRIKGQFQHLIRKNTIALLKQKNIMVGDWNIELTGGTEEISMVKNGDTLNSELPVQIEKTINQFTGMISAIDQGVRKVLAGEGTVGKLLTQDSLANLIYLTGQNVNGLTIQSAKILNRSDTFVTNLVDISRAANQITDSVKVISAKVSTVIDSVEKILMDVKMASGEVPPLLNQLRIDISEADIMMKSVQNSWLMKMLSRPQIDPMLKENP